MTTKQFEPEHMPAKRGGHPFELGERTVRPFKNLTLVGEHLPLLFNFLALAI
jgi:hypothetical protein